MSMRLIGSILLADLIKEDHILTLPGHTAVVIDSAIIKLDLVLLVGLIIIHLGGLYLPFNDPVSFLRSKTNGLVAA